MREFSLRFRMVLKVDAGIGRFDYSAPMRIEKEANSVLEIIALAFDNQVMVEVPCCWCSLKYVKPIVVTGKKVKKYLSRLSSLN